METSQFSDQKDGASADGLSFPTGSARAGEYHRSIALALATTVADARSSSLRPWTTVGSLSMRSSSNTIAVNSRTRDSGLGFVRSPRVKRRQYDRSSPEISATRVMLFPDTRSIRLRTWVNSFSKTLLEQTSRTCSAQLETIPNQLLTAPTLQTQ